MPTNSLFATSTFENSLPTFRYSGGKALLRRWLCRFFPESGNRYVEPFVGRGNVFFAATRLGKFKSWQINDTRTIPFFKALTTLDIRRIDESLTHRDLNWWLELRGKGDPLAEVMEPILMWAGGSYNKGSFVGSKWWTGKDRLKEYRYNCREARRILRQTEPELTELDWMKTVEGLGPDDFVYLDPPYKGANTIAYSENEVDHATLVKVLKRAKFRWILSEYKHPVYKPLGEPIATYHTRSTTSRCGDNRRVECLWSNFPALPRALDIYGYRDNPLQSAKSLLPRSGSITFAEIEKRFRSWSWAEATVSAQLQRLKYFPITYENNQSIWWLSSFRDELKQRYDGVLKA